MMWRRRELVVSEIADVDARPQSPDGVDETARDEDLVDGLPDVSEAEMEELFDSDVTETDDESEKDDDDDDVDDVDDVDEEDENAEMIHERAHVVEADAPLVEGGSREPGDEPGDMPVVLTPIHPALRPDEAIVPSSSDPLVVGQKRRLLGSLASDDEGADAGPAKRTRICRWLTSTLTSSSECCPCRTRTRSGSTESTTIKRSGPTSYLPISLDFQVPEEDDAGARADDEEPAQDQLETTRRTRRTRTTPWSTQKPRGSSEDSHWRHCLLLRDARRSGVRQSTSTAQSRSGHSTASVPSTPSCGLDRRGRRQSVRSEPPRRPPLLLLGKPPRTS